MTSGLQPTGRFNMGASHGDIVGREKGKALGVLGQEITRGLADPCLPPDADKYPEEYDQYCRGNKWDELTPSHQRSVMGCIGDALNNIGKEGQPKGKIPNLSELKTASKAIPSSVGTVGKNVDYKEPDPIAPVPDGGKK